MYGPEGRIWLCAFAIDSYHSELLWLLTNTITIKTLKTYHIAGAFFPRNRKEKKQNWSKRVVKFRNKESMGYRVGVNRKYLYGKGLWFPKHSLLGMKKVLYRIMD